MGGVGGVLHDTFCFAGGQGFFICHMINYTGYNQASCKEHRVRKISRMEGRGPPMIFAAVFTVRWRVLRSAAQQFPYQTVMQLVSTLSMVPL